MGQSCVGSDGCPTDGVWVDGASGDLLPEGHDVLMTGLVSASEGFRFLGIHPIRSSSPFSYDSFIAETSIWRRLSVVFPSFAMRSRKVLESRNPSV